MKPFVIPAAKHADFTEGKPLGKPVGDRVPEARFAFANVQESEGIATGIWQCTEGKFIREVAQAEFSYFIEGKGYFTPEGEEPLAFKAGESIYFSANTQGVWTIEEPVTKSYIIFS
ncbi:cupin domain-containing protein [Marinobacterium stanieri]|uniref:cupin domain-containing protein n=1 Tax=Marinobacterium stanieri TaxID=49186 RepID=UPI0002558B70|nr:cupin domain-containing protein [Marinobacterium stanieri]